MKKKLTCSFALAGVAVILVSCNNASTKETSELRDTSTAPGIFKDRILKQQSYAKWSGVGYYYPYEQGKSQNDGSFTPDSVKNVTCSVEFTDVSNSSSSNSGPGIHMVVTADKEKVETTFDESTLQNLDSLFGSNVKFINNKSPQSIEKQLATKIDPNLKNCRDVVNSTSTTFDGTKNDWVSVHRLVECYDLDSTEVSTKITAFLT